MTWLTSAWMMKQGGEPGDETRDTMGDRIRVQVKQTRAASGDSAARTTSLPRRFTSSRQFVSL